MTQFQATVVILLMCIGLGLLGWYTFEVSPGFEERFDSGLAKLSAVSDKMNAPGQWEYRIESLPDRTFDQRINALGQEGWELVFARRASDGSDYSPTFSYEMIFKRPKKFNTESSEKTHDKKQASTHK